MPPAIIFDTLVSFSYILLQCMHVYYYKKKEPMSKLDRLISNHKIYLCNQLFYVKSEYMWDEQSEDQQHEQVTQNT